MNSIFDNAICDRCWSVVPRGRILDEPLFFQRLKIFRFVTAVRNAYRLLHSSPHFRPFKNAVIRADCWVLVWSRDTARSEPVILYFWCRRAGRAFGTVQTRVTHAYQFIYQGAFDVQHAIVSCKWLRLLDAQSKSIVSRLRCK